MKEVDFDDLERTCSDVAEEFLEGLELLPLFLNYLPAVRKKWLKQARVKQKDIKIIEKVCDEYAKRKIQLVNKKLPKTRKQVIKIEDEILRKMYEGKILKVKKGKLTKKSALKLIKNLYKNCAILGPNELAKLEDLMLFKSHIDRPPLNFLIFDPKKKKIIGIEVVKKC